MLIAQHLVPPPWSIPSLPVRKRTLIASEQLRPWAAGLLQCFGAETVQLLPRWVVRRANKGRSDPRSESASSSVEQVGLPKKTKDMEKKMRTEDFP